jgi:hypothetical protein
MPATDPGAAVKVDRRRRACADPPDLRPIWPQKIPAILLTGIPKITAGRYFQPRFFFAGSILNNFAAIFAMPASASASILLTFLVSPSRLALNISV